MVLYGFIRFLTVSHGFLRFLTFVISIREATVLNFDQPYTHEPKVLSNEDANFCKYSVCRDWIFNVK